MGRLRVVIVIVIAMTAALLLLAPLSSADSNTVKAYYKDVQDIRVEFPNGKEIAKGGELIIITFSDVYDMYRSGIMFYECDKDGIPDTTTSIKPTHTDVVDGYTVTHYFSGLETSIEMDFSDLVTLDPQNVVPKTPHGTIDIFGDDLLTTIVILASLAIGAVMLAIMALVIRMLDSYRFETEMTK